MLKLNDPGFTFEFGAFRALHQNTFRKDNDVITFLGRLAILLITSFFLISSHVYALDSSDFLDEVIVSAEFIVGLTVTDTGNVYCVNYIDGTLCELNQADGNLTTIVDELMSPTEVEYFNGKLYFTESGSSANEYQDGRLSTYDLSTQQIDVVAGTLHFPVDLFVDSTGNVYVLESFHSFSGDSGTDRIIKFQGSGEPTVLLDSVPRLNRFVVDDAGYIYIGTMGSTSPGDEGKLLKYDPVNLSNYETLLTGLPSVHSLSIDENGNIYIAGMGSDSGERIGIA